MAVKMRAPRGGDKLGITSGRRNVRSQRPPYVVCLPDVCPGAIFIRGVAHRATRGKL